MVMEWIDVNEKMPKGKGDIVKVRRANGNEIKAYYHEDSMHWLSFYTSAPLSKFQCYETRNFLHDVTHWTHYNQNRMKDE